MCVKCSQEFHSNILNMKIFHITVVVSHHHDYALCMPAATMKEMGPHDNLFPFEPKYPLKHSSLNPISLKLSPQTI